MKLSKMDLFMEIVNGFQPLTNLAKSSILDVRLDSGYASAIRLPDDHDKIDDELSAVNSTIMTIRS